MSLGLTLISLNVRGMRERDKRTKIFEWCKKKEGDIVFLQETFSTVDVEERWKREWGGPMLFSHGTNHSRGVMVLISSELKSKISHIDVDDDGRYILFKLETRDIGMLLVNLYFPTRDKENLQVEFLEKLDRVISKVWVPDCPLVLGGDFNLIMDGKVDYMGSHSVRKTKFNDKFEEFLIRYRIEDIWRKRNPRKKEYTFRQKQPVVQTRLDYWFISLSLYKLVNKCAIVSSITPDHSGVLLQFRELKENYDFGRSYWKFNNSLCNDIFFVDKLTAKIIEWKEQLILDFTSKMTSWDFLKMKMREFIISYSRERAKFRRFEIEKLEKEIAELESQLLVTPLRNKVDEIEDKKSLLNKLYEYSRQGIRVRSRAEWFEEGENNIQYFEQLLRSNKRKSVIKELYNENNEVIRNKNDILKKIKLFYENLYSERERHEENKSIFFENILKLEKESRDLCEGKITKEECFRALEEMKLNKSPGNDGFTAEFYQKFWPVLGGSLVDTLNDAFERGELSASQKQGVITLIEKEGKDAMYIKNYRPITLLNVDYKILSKVLANRIKEVLSQIIHSDQVGYIKERNIGEAVRLIDDMFFHSLNQTNGFLVAVDFEKAFDSVSHDFLSEVLELFGFGDSFCSWIRVLYKDISSCVMNGGHSTGYFKIKRGVRQGDPLSPYLFLFVIELLAHAIRKDTGIKGFQFGKHEIRQISYADDCTLFVKDATSLNRIQNIFEEFEKISGLKINKGKTNFVWMGKESEQPEVPIFGNLVQEIKILGVHFCLDRSKKDDLNYKEILSKIKRLLGWWKQRDLTLVGKVHLLKTYALSKLNYVSSLILVPKWVYVEVEKLSFEFLWGGNDRIKRNIMYQDYEYGGIKITNYRIFVKTQRIMWMKRLIYGEKKMGWKLYFDYVCESVGGRFIFLCDYEISKLKLIIPQFYLDILKAWQELKEVLQGEGQVLNPIIFNNRNICLKGRMIFNSNLYDKGIYLIKDIVYEGHIRPLEYFQNLQINSKDLLMISDIYKGIQAALKDASGLIEFQEADIVNFAIELNISGQNIMFKDIKSRKIYDYLIKELRKLFALQISDNETNIQLTEKQTIEIYSDLRGMTLIRKYRDFQYKLLHKAIYTKEHLFRFGFVTNNFCSFCHQDVETYIHVFLNCPKVKEMWKTMIQLFELTEIITLEWKDIFVGLTGKSIRIKFVNTLIVMLKYIIFKSRKGPTLPSLRKIQKDILNYREEEKKLAIKKGKLGLHMQKWEYIERLDL